MPSPKPDVIWLVPIGHVSSADQTATRLALTKTFSAEVMVRPSMPLPKEAYYAPHGRYRAGKLISILSAVARGNHVIGLTGVDISTTNGKIRDWGVLGLGDGAIRACVVSTFRMGRTDVSKEVFETRLMRVCEHELGHAYGLPHCPTPRCLMNDAKGRIKTVDNGTGDFCPSCHRFLGPHLRRPGR